MNDKFQNWMRSVANAARTHCLDPNSLYYGADGARRPGRECGPALLDFGSYGIKNIGSTYGAICVIAYSLKPPIDAAEWLNAVREGYNKAKAYDSRAKLWESE